MTTHSRIRQGGEMNWQVVDGGIDGVEDQPKISERFKQLLNSVYYIGRRGAVSTEL